MKQTDIVEKVAQRTSLDQEKAGQVVAAFIEVLSDHFLRGEKVVLSEFGSFYITEDKRIQFHPSSRVKEMIE